MGSGERLEVDIREEKGCDATGNVPVTHTHTLQRQRHITSHATFSNKFLPALHGNVDNT